GNISHGGGATVTTPVATIGVRGGVAVISHVKSNCAKQGAGGAPTTAVDNVFGQSTVTTPSGEEVIRRPGYGVSVCGAGAKPSSPDLVSQESIDETNRLLTSKGAQTGGYRGPVGDKSPNLDLVSRQPWQNFANGVNPLTDPNQ